MNIDLDTDSDKKKYCTKCDGELYEYCGTCSYQNSPYDTPYTCNCGLIDVEFGLCTYCHRCVYCCDCSNDYVHNTDNEKDMVEVAIYRGDYMKDNEYYFVLSPWTLRKFERYAGLCRKTVNDFDFYINSKYTKYPRHHPALIKALKGSDDHHIYIAHINKEDIDCYSIEIVNNRESICYKVKS